MTDDQDAPGIRPIPRDKRPRPALPPGADPADPRWHVGPRPASGLRRIPDLFRDTFSLIVRRRRPLGEYAVIGAACYVVAFVMLFLGLNALFGGQFFAKFDELSDPTGEAVPDFEAWLASFDVTPTATAITLLVLFVVASMAAYFVQDIATTLAAIDDVNGREIDVGSNLATAFRRLLKVSLLAVAVCLACCGGCLLSALIALPLAIVWGLAALVFTPLTSIYLAMAYVEPGLPSFRRWWHLMRGCKAARIAVQTRIFSLTTSFLLRRAAASRPTTFSCLRELQSREER